MRSHSGNNGKPSQSTSAATLLVLQCKLKKFWMLVRQGGEDGPERRTQLLPYATHQHITPVTSYTPHFIWNAVARQELNGIADAFLHVCWLVCHMLRLSFCLRNSTSWDYMTCSCKKNKKWWATVLWCFSLPYLTSCRSWYTTDLCDRCWSGERNPRSEITKHNCSHHGRVVFSLHSHPPKYPSPTMK